MLLLVCYSLLLFDVMFLCKAGLVFGYVIYIRSGITPYIIGIYQRSFLLAHNITVRTKGYSTNLLDPTQVESKNTIVKSNGLSRVLMLNLWIFSLEKNKSENSGLNNLTIYYKLIKTAIKRKYNQINLGTKQYLTLIQSSINPPSIILSQQFLPQFLTNLQRPSLYRTERIFSNNRERSNS